MRALILDGAYSRGALAATRSLGRAGWTVGIGTMGGRSRAAASRYAAAVHPLPWPARGSEAFVEAVAAAIATGGYELVFPTADVELLALSAARGRLGSTLPYPPHETVVRTLDKRSLAEAARAAGASVPGAGEGRYPVVVKPRLRAAPPEGGTEVGTEVVGSAGEAAAAAAALEAEGVEPFTQELVPGDLLAYAVVVDTEGRPLARSQQRAAAIFPAGAGSSVRAITQPVDEELERISLAVLRRLGYHGLAQVQFIESADGEHFLIDVNIRFFGSMQLAIAAGADLPLAWAGGLRDPQTALPGVRFHALHGDLKRAAASGSWRDALSAARYALGAAHGVWQPRDPRPALVYPRQRLERVLRERRLPQLRAR